MTIEMRSAEDLLFMNLRVTTAQRLRAARGGEDGLCVLLARQRSASLMQLRLSCANLSYQNLHAA